MATRNAIKRSILIPLLLFIPLFVLAQNDTIKLADPTIFSDAGTYYLYGTGNPKGFSVYTSTDLKHWTLAPKLALTAGDSYGTTGFWAPQVFNHHGKYYMAYTANEHIAIAVSDSPLGPFKQDQLHAVALPGRQIDPYIFRDSDGKLYLYYVRLKKGNRIFVTRLKDDLSNVADTTAIECISASPEAKWENTANADWPVTEGPTVIKIKDTYYLFYSANDFRNIDYAVGYATATSPLGPWKRYKGNPLISRKNTLKNGSGHGDILVDEHGKLWYVFHTHRSNSKVQPRLTAIVGLTTTGRKSHFKLVPGSFSYLTR